VVQQAVVGFEVSRIRSPVREPQIPKSTTKVELALRVSKLALAYLRIEVRPSVGDESDRCGVVADHERGSLVLRLLQLMQEVGVRVQSLEIAGLQR
jgi:hypothetical protein